jgi:glucokinase
VAVGENPPLVYQKVLELFIKIYSSAIATFMAGHLTVGGIYLVGSLTNSVLPKLKGRDLFEGFKTRHPEVAKMVENVPIITCKETELGLRGAFFIAKRIFSKHS